MSRVTVHLDDYKTGDGKQPGIEVDHYEGLVHLDSRSIEDGDGSTPSLRPSEARALAAALIHAASQVDP